MNLNPGSVAIVGLSGNAEKHGARVLRSLLAAGFDGEIYGVHPDTPNVEGVHMVASTSELPNAVDLVLCAIPAGAIPEAVRGLRGPGTVVVFSGGFSELGTTGSDLQAELVEAAHAAGVRVVGPNSGGVLSMGQGLAASFLTFLDRPTEQLKDGPVAVVSQSGGLLSYLHNVAADRGQGVGAAVSTGNEADMTVADAITAVTQVPGVRSITLVVETIRDGSAFVNAVRRAHDAGVRVTVCHIGSSERSSHMLATHTGALATDRRVFEGVCRSLGIAMAATPEEAFDVADVLAHLEPVSGDRIGVVTHSGGLAILLNDLAAQRDFHLPAPSDSLVGTVEPFMELGAIKNPLDMGAIIGGPHRFASVVKAFVGEYDLVLAVTSAHPPAHTAERVESLLEIDDGVLHLWMAGDQGAESLAKLRAGGAAVVIEPRAAIAAVGGAAALLHRDVTESRVAVLAPSLILSEHESKGLLSQHGVPVVEGGLGKTPEEAVALFKALGAPVAVKVSSPDVLHKAKVGGIRLDVTTTDAVRGAFMDIQTATLDAQPQATVDGVRIERQVAGLQEVLVSGFVDPIFGPMVAVGRGGSQVEAMDDVAMAMAPVSMPFAERLVKNLTSGPNNDGGAARTESLADVVVKVSELAATSIEAEINPLTWTGTEWLAVDAVVRR